MSFMEIFQPGLKYLREERERQRMNVAYPTDGADPLMEIDLEAGTATIVIAADASSPGTGSATESTAQAGSDDPAAAGSVSGEPGETSPDELTEMDRPASG